MMGFSNRHKKKVESQPAKRINRTWALSFAVAMDFKTSVVHHNNATFAS